MIAVDTIYAVSSGAGRAGIAVVRLSGPGSRGALEALGGPLPSARRASLRSIRGRNGETIDRGLVLWFPAPASFTGEDMAEVHVHGGRAVVAGVLEALGSLEGLRPAEAGEFTRRAFEAGRLDLTEVEGLADLIEAETAAQRRQALRHLEGEAGRRIEAWRGQVIELSALCEAGIDFADEDDVPAEIGGRLVAGIGELLRDVTAVLDDDRRGEGIREGLSVVIAGPPNAGKSSLLNALARRDVAIVSEIAGTTRDALEVRLDLDGLAVNVVDTAGIRETADSIESEGVRRALRYARSADLVLWMVEAGSDSAPEGSIGEVVWTVENKIDLAACRTAHASGDRFGISVKTGAGVDELMDAISSWMRDRFGSGTESLVTRARHRRELSTAAAALARAMGLDYRAEPELVGEELRAAAGALGRLTGRIDVEEVLDQIFGQFCIGK